MRDPGNEVVLSAVLLHVCMLLKDAITSTCINLCFLNFFQLKY